MNTLPGIVKIEVVRCDQLPDNVMLIAITRGVVTLVLQPQEVKFYGQPSLKWEGSLVNKAPQEKSTLEFRTPMRLRDDVRLAFIVTAASGKKYLIGSREGKYPVVTYTETTGAPDGEAALRTYKITHIARKSVLECIV